MYFEQTFEAVSDAKKNHLISFIQNRLIIKCYENNSNDLKYDQH